MAQPFAGNPAAGNPASNATTFYTNKPSLLIPFNQDPTTPVAWVNLHLSEDYGKTWRYVANAQRNQRTFPFRAPRDGWYWFAVQTQDQYGRFTPANMSQAQAELKLCVDTIPPQIYVKGTLTSGGAATLDWEIRDENIELASLKVETRQAGATEWVPLSVQPQAKWTHAWNTGPGQMEARVSIRDKAGNLSEQVLPLIPGQTKTAGVAGPALAPGVAGAGNPGVPPNVLMVNHRKFLLNFKLEDVGPSDVSRIEVWFTRDGGRTWRKFDADAEKNPPCKLEVPEEGRYGFTLIARSGVEMSEPPPKPGDQPHIWVEVDETKPSIPAMNVEVGRGVDQGTMKVTWSAADKFLGPTPITLSYGSSATGPWTVAAKELANSGYYVWKLPDQGLPFQFFLKLDCTDMAGNTASVITPGPVKVDLATPRARVVGVTAVGISADPSPGGASGAGAPGNGGAAVPGWSGNNPPIANPNPNPGAGTPGGSPAPSSAPPLPMGNPGNPSGANPGAGANPFPGVESPKAPPTGGNAPPAGANPSNTPKPQPLPSSPSGGTPAGSPTPMAGGSGSPFPNLPGLPPG